jgi:hypothetical protein
MKHDTVAMLVAMLCLAAAITFNSPAAAKTFWSLAMAALIMAAHQE